ncbi:MAG TPA: peptidase, partial [Methylophaga aminisulfidivorans]|nr:peptidase [Methylophaga aminisulfidivorans]
MYSKRKSIGFIIVTVLASMILLNVLAGLLINHAKQLELDQRFISWPWLMEHYGIGSVSPDVSYLVNNTIFSQFDNQLFADAMPIRHIERPLIGGIQLEDLIVLATDDALLLLTPEGEFVER